MGPLAGYALPPRARRTRELYSCRAHAICALGFYIVANSAHLDRRQSPAAENTKPRISECASSAHALLAVLCVDALVGAWRSLVARLLWEQDVAGSNPVVPTISCGRSSMVEPQPSKLMTRVRFPSPAPQDSLTALIPFGIRAVFVNVPGDGNRTRQGAKLRKCVSIFQRSTQGPMARSETRVCEANPWTSRRPLHKMDEWLWFLLGPEPFS